MITSETALVDTNVLVYAADGTSPFHQPSKHLRDKGLRGEVSLCIFPQIFSELFAVITDPRRVTNPRAQEEAIAEIEKYLEEEHLLKLYAGPDIMEIMLDLLRRYEIKNRKSLICSSWLPCFPTTSSGFTPSIGGTSRNLRK